MSRNITIGNETLSYRVNVSNGVVVTLLTDLVVTFIIASSAILCIRKICPIYNKTDSQIKRELELKKSSKRRCTPQGCWSWFLRWTFFLQEEYKIFSKRYGRGAGLYLYFVRIIIYILLFLTFVSCVVLFPVYGFGGELTPIRLTANQSSYSWGGVYSYTEKDNWLLFISIARIQNCLSAYKSLTMLLLPVFLCYIYTIVIFAFLFCFTNSSFVSSHVNTERNISNYTIHVKGLPKGNSVDFEALKEEKLTRSANRLFDNKVKAFRVAFKTGQRNEYQSKMDEIDDYLQHFEKMTKEKVYNPIYLLKGVKWKEMTKTGLIKLYQEKKKSLEAKIIQWEKEFKSNPKSTGQGHIIFNSRKDKEKHGDKKLGDHFTLKVGDQRVKFRMHKKAKEPTDIIWGNFIYGKMLWCWRTFAVHFIMIVYTMIFVNPVAVISSLLKLSYQYFQFFWDPLITYKRFFGDVVINFGLGLASVAFVSFIPYIPWLATIFNIERIKYISRLVNTNSRRVFIYTVLTSVVLPTLVLTAGDVIWMLLINPKEFSKAVWKEMFLPSSGAYFVNFLIHYSFISFGSSFLTVGDMGWFLYKRFFAITNKEKENAINSANLRMGLRMGKDINVLAMIFVYSIMCPLVSVVGLAFFVGQYILQRLNIVNVYSKNVKKFIKVKLDRHSYELRIRNIFYLMFANVMLFHSFTFLYFLKMALDSRYYWVHVGLIIGLNVLTWGYGFIWHVTYKIKAVSCYDSGEENSMDEKDVEPLITGEKSEKSEKFESLDVEETEIDKFFSKKELEECYKPPFTFLYHRPCSISDINEFRKYYSRSSGRFIELE